MDCDDIIDEIYNPEDTIKNYLVSNNKPQIKNERLNQREYIEMSSFENQEEKIVN